MDEPYDEDYPVTDAAEAFIAKQERREQQGLDRFPFPDGLEPFTNLDEPSVHYTVNDMDEVCRIVSSWYVKKANYYHDVGNLQVKYQPHDIKQVIVHRMKEVFPDWKASEQTWRDFFKLILDPPVNKLNPEHSIPVWSGKRVCLPGNPQKVFFKDGTATVNIWQAPAYRKEIGSPHSSLDAFLKFVIPNDKDRDVFLNWLAWCLQNEDEKPSWAVMLYSNKQGTGKSTLTDMMKALFGAENTGRTNGVAKLVGRFNKEVLENKLVIVEEVEVKRGSPQANSLKSLITEDSTMVEAKGLPTYVEQIHCAFVMTTNHLPLWLEESDRRFFILDFDHDGYANGGPRHQKFARLVAALKSELKDPRVLRGIYDMLMSRAVAFNFGHTFDVQQNSTDIMKRLADLSPDVAKQMVAETLAEHCIVFIPVDTAHRVINMFAAREINSQTHLFTELGWKKRRFAWGGKGQKWAWYNELDPSYPASRGRVWSGHNWDSMSDQIAKIERLLDPQSDHYGV